MQPHITVNTDQRVSDNDTIKPEWSHSSTVTVGLGLQNRTMEYRWRKLQADVSLVNKPTA